jgi:hypothetical protein
MATAIARMTHLLSVGGWSADMTCDTGWLLMSAALMLAALSSAISPLGSVLARSCSR